MSQSVDQDANAISADSPRSDFTNSEVINHAPVRPDEVDRAAGWSRQRPRITIGAATLLAIAASGATAISIRRRQQQRIGRLAWLTARANALGAATAEVPPMARAGGVGGLGGALMLAALLGARMRQAQAQAELQSLAERLAALEERSNAAGGKPRPRDVAIGAAIGLALTGLIARRPGRQREAKTAKPSS